LIGILFPLSLPVTPPRAHAGKTLLQETRMQKGDNAGGSPLQPLHQRQHRNTGVLGGFMRMYGLMLFVHEEI